MLSEKRGLSLLEYGERAGAKFKILTSLESLSSPRFRGWVVEVGGEARKSETFQEVFEARS